MSDTTAEVGEATLTVDQLRRLIMDAQRGHRCTCDLCAQARAFAWEAAWPGRARGTAIEYRDFNVSGAVG